MSSTRAVPPGPAGQTTSQMTTDKEKTVLSFGVIENRGVTIAPELGTISLVGAI